MDIFMEQDLPGFKHIPMLLLYHTLYLTSLNDNN